MMVVATSLHRTSESLGEPERPTEASREEEALKDGSAELAVSQETLKNRQVLGNDVFKKWSHEI